MKVLNYEIFKLHAEFCKTLANPKRLIIITALSLKEMTVSELAELLDIPISNVSQHLKILRDKYIVETKKVGQHIYYSIQDKRLYEACKIIRNIIFDINKKKGRILGENIETENLIDLK